jgi:hypothetical protein
MGRPIIFLGPSLESEAAIQVIDADFRPPVKQGDILRAAVDDPPAIGIVDGIFRNAPTIRHRDIMWVLSRVIPVFGAASMGALRASELCQHGMIGVGFIYRWYRRCPLAADDAVAVTHTPMELGSRPLSDALIDIRLNLRAMVRAGDLTPDEAFILQDAAKELEFGKRSYEAVAALAAEKPAAKLRNSPRPSRKRQDALELLQLFAKYAQSGDWPVPVICPPPLVHAWLDDLRDGGFNPDAFREDMKKEIK